MHPALTTLQAADPLEAVGGATAGIDDVAGLLRAAVRARLAGGDVSLPLLPQVASQVVMLAGNPSADAVQLSALIHRDPALAGQVLRIANSPTYLPRMPIVSLQQAIARLGLNVVIEIAFVASMQSGTFKVPGYEVELKRLWRHAIASGIFAKEIARIRRSNVEAAFLCGLLHAVGKPALLQVVADFERSSDAHRVAASVSAGATSDTSATAGANGGATVRANVSAILDEFHTEVGLRIAELWALPGSVVTAIGTYSSYQQARPLVVEAAITCLADRLATDLIDAGHFDEATLLDHEVWKHLNLYPADVANLRAKRAKVAETVDAMTV